MGTNNQIVAAQDPASVQNAERLRENEEIRKICSTTKLNSEFSENLIRCGFSLDQARTKILDELARQSDKFSINSHHSEITRDYREGLADSIAEGLSCRFSGKQPTERARQFVGMSMESIAKECLQAAGIRYTASSRQEIIRLAMMGTSDFPNLLAGFGRRTLLDSYQAASSALKMACRKSTAEDFRAKYALRIGEFPSLKPINEHGEIQHGPMDEAVQSYSLKTFGRMIGLTRQAIINDDLGAFVDLTGKAGQAAANLEGDQLVALLASNPVLSDTVALFYATHGNLAGSGGAISDTTLGAARLGLRTMKGIDGTTIIAVNPKFLLVPAALETTAEKYLAALYPAESANVNPFSGKLELLVEARLDANSLTAWYLFGDPTLCPVIEYSYLTGSEGPQIEQRTGWEVLGVELRVIMDFGCGAIDYRGAYMNPGA